MHILVRKKNESYSVIFLIYNGLNVKLVIFIIFKIFKLNFKYEFSKI